MMHIKIICCLVAIVLIKSASGQKVYTYYLDPYLNITDKKDAAAVYKGKGQRQDSIFVVDCYNKETDHLAITASFTDSLLTNLHGKFESFYIIQHLRYSHSVYIWIKSFFTNSRCQ